jgi:hypothetical protein
MKRTLFTLAAFAIIAPALPALAQTEGEVTVIELRSCSDVEDALAILRKEVDAFSLDISDGKCAVVTPTGSAVAKITEALQNEGISIEAFSREARGKGSQSQTGAGTLNRHSRGETSGRSGEGLIGVAKDKVYELGDQLLDKINITGKKNTQNQE